METIDDGSFAAAVERMLGAAGWRAGDPAEWDAARGFFAGEVLRFIQSTQSALWRAMMSLNGGDLEPRLLIALIGDLAAHGVLHVLRNGFGFGGRSIRLAYLKSGDESSAADAEDSRQNWLTMTPGLPMSAAAGSSFDFVLSIGGLPVATFILADSNAGQTWRDAVRRYRDDCDAQMPLCRFRIGALLHFAVDPDEVHWTSRLEGERTLFQPFNRGSHPGRVQSGAGNPPHPSGMRTAYFWQEILRPDTFLDLLGQTLFMTKEVQQSGSRASAESPVRDRLLFPRYHQFDAMRALTAKVRAEGVGNRYLVQHSAGSGKGSTLVWLAHRLAHLRDLRGRTLLDTIVVVTDRDSVFAQLRDVLAQSESGSLAVKAIDEDRQQLADGMIEGDGILVVPLRQLPFVLCCMLDAEDAADRDSDEEQPQTGAWLRRIGERRYAILLDEMHSRHIMDVVVDLKTLLSLGASQDDALEEEPGGVEENDWEDLLSQLVVARGQPRNLSLFLFSPTPTLRTLGVFGHSSPDGSLEAAHIYPMRQAIEEGFILDVLRNYATFGTWSAFLADPAQPLPGDGPRSSTAEDASEVGLDDIESRAAVIVEHFLHHVHDQLGGRAKAMVVASDALSALRYKRALDRCLLAKGVEDIKTLVAFNGVVTDPDRGVACYEPDLNLTSTTGQSIPEDRLIELFGYSRYRLLVVANKYQTWLDQPQLCAMYVDQKLEGVRAVQTLLRLGHKADGKIEPFVLDFANNAETIYSAFKPYFDSTSLQESARPEMLASIKYELDQMQFYQWDEVEAFAGVFYRQAYRQTPADHALMQRCLQPAVARFRASDDATLQTLFREKLAEYVGVYAFLCQILPRATQELEWLYSFGRYLLPQLPAGRGRAAFQVTGPKVALDQALEGALPGKASESDQVADEDADSDRGGLSEIAQSLAELLSAESAIDDARFLEGLRDCAAGYAKVAESARELGLDEFQASIRDLIRELLVQRIADNDRVVTRYLESAEFRDRILPILSRQIFESVRRA